MNKNYHYHYHYHIVVKGITISVHSCLAAHLRRLMPSCAVPGLRGMGDGSNDMERVLQSVMCGSNGDDDTACYQEGLLQTLDGFLLVLSTSGDVAFVSSTIATYLGLQQVGYTPP